MSRFKQPSPLIVKPTLVQRVLRFVPRGLSGLMVISFGVGAGMELFMAKVKVNGINFYDVAKRKKAEQIVDAEEQAEQSRIRLGDGQDQAKTQG